MVQLSSGTSQWNTNTLAGLIHAPLAQCTHDIHESQPRNYHRATLLLQLSTTVFAIACYYWRQVLRTTRLVVFHWKISSISNMVKSHRAHGSLFSAPNFNTQSIGKCLPHQRHQPQHMHEQRLLSASLGWKGFLYILHVPTAVWFSDLRVVRHHGATKNANVDFNCGVLAYQVGWSDKTSAKSNQKLKFTFRQIISNNAQ